MGWDFHFDDKYMSDNRNESKSVSQSVSLFVGRRIKDGKVEGDEVHFMIKKLSSLV